MSTVHGFADHCRPPAVALPERRGVGSAAHRLTGVLAALVLGSGCQIGPRPERLPMQVQAAGTMVEVDILTGDGENLQSLRGELLAVEPDAVLLLSDSIRKIDYGVIERITAVGHALARTGWGGPPAQSAEELRLVSRYPNGVPAGVLPRLLAALGQAEVRRITPATGGRP